MNVTNEDIKRLEPFQLQSNSFQTGGTIYHYNDMLYKILSEYFFKDEIMRNVDFQIENHIPNSPYIYEKIFLHGNFYGYSMEYLENAITFREASKYCFDIDKCLGIVHDIYTGVRFLHDRDILLGDVHMDNLMVDDKGHGYLIDLDHMLFPGDDYKFNTLYSLKYSHDGYRNIKSSKKTDNIKVMLCCLSLMFGVDIENEMISSYGIDIESVYEKYIMLVGSDELKDYFCDIIQGKDVVYFDDFCKNNDLFCHKKRSLVK